MCPRRKNKRMGHVFSDVGADMTNTRQNSYVRSCTSMDDSHNWERKVGAPLSLKNHDTRRWKRRRLRGVCQNIIEDQGIMKTRTWDLELNTCIIANDQNWSIMERGTVKTDGIECLGRFTLPDERMFENVCTIRYRIKILIFSAPINVGARKGGNPKNLAASFARPSTSTNASVRVRVPNRREGQGHLEKFTKSGSPLFSRRKGAMKASKADMSCVPNIKCLESAFPWTIHQSETSMREGFMIISHGKNLGFPSSTMNGRRAFQNILECHVTRMKNESKTSYKATTISQNKYDKF